MSITLGDARIPDGTRTYAIGDVHGCLAELKALMKAIDDDLERRPVDRHRIVLVGDYIDRGPDSCGVIEYLIEANQRDEVTCLRGNHDDRFIEFLRDPEMQAPGFFSYGGSDTLRSYGMSVAGNSTLTVDIASRLAAEAADCVSKEHREFLDSLQFSTIEGDYFFCHAGIRPGISVDKQESHDLLWIRGLFLQHEAAFSHVVIHGHTPVDEPEICRNRINIDTACVYGNRLTALVLEGSDFRFLSVDHGVGNVRTLNPGSG